MSTRSNIVRENADGSFDAIYCHWDGYPSHNGAILLEHYQDQRKIERLIKLGDLSVLGAEIGTKHAFDAQPEGQCTAYGRDRGERGTRAKHYPSMEQLAADIEAGWTEWVYLYRVSEARWYFTNNPTPTWFKCCGTEQRTMDLLTPAAIAEVSA